MKGRVLYISLLLLYSALMPAEEAKTFAVPNFWFNDGEDPPAQKPYKLPRFDNHYEEDHYTPIAPIKIAPYINAEQLFNTINNCYPEVSKFSLDVSLEANYKNRASFDTNGANIGRHYIGIVARMPLYSATELNREREREHMRRAQTAALIGSFMTNLAKRNHSVRELGLYSSLEARAQIRVLQGVTDTGEQVKYLEKVADAQRNLITAEALLIRYRLEMVAMCQNGKAGAISRYIKQLTQLPKN
jgi:hypothetical protein